MCRVLAPVSTRGRSGEFRFHRRRSAAAMRYTERAWPRSPTRCWRTSTRIRSTSSRTMTRTSRSYRPAHADPNLLVNGSSGIAVGMATNIRPQPHGGGGRAHHADRESDATVDDLMKVIPAGLPDAGLHLRPDRHPRCLYDGAGIITLRAKVHKESLRAARGDHRHGAPVSGQQGDADGEDRRADP